MGGKKKKYNARFPPARIKKIMQTDEEVGKIAAPVPVVISRALELFLETIISESVNAANETNAKTLTSSHIKSVIHSNVALDFLKSQVTLVPDLNPSGSEGSATVSDKLSVHKTSTDASSLSTPTASSNTDNAQTPHPIISAKKRARPATATTITLDDPDAADSKKPKRRRGRPPKIKQEDGAEDIKPSLPRATEPMSSVLPSSQQTDQVSTNGHVKVKEEATAVPTHHVSYSSIEERSRLPESIFSTETTFLSKSGYQSPAAHSGSVMSRLAATHNLGLHLSYPKSEHTSDSLQAMYANLSPTSQPMDLSTRPPSLVDPPNKHYSSAADTPYQGHSAAGGYNSGQRVSSNPVSASDNLYTTSTAVLEG